MKYLSHFINNETPCYGNRADIKISAKSAMSCGDTCNALNISISNHVGTHIDLPHHFDINGLTLQSYPASFWVRSKVQIIEVEAQKDQLIQSHDIEEVIDPNTEVLIIKTGFEKYRAKEEYWNNNPGIHQDLALDLRLNYPKLSIIGFDFISLTAFQHRLHGRSAHKNLLSSKVSQKRPICIIEDMSLKDITKETKVSTLIISPLLIENADGIQVTVLAETES